MWTIKNINLKNFKSIHSITLPFKPLTFLTGLNSSGKSSIINFLCIAHKLSKKESISNYGSCSDLRCHYANTGHEIQGTINFQNRTIDDEIGTQDIEILYQSGDLVHGEARVCWDFNFVSANRLGPQVTLPISSNDVLNVGELGEAVIPFCIQQQERNVLFTSDPRLHENADGDTFDLNLNAWMEEICPGIKIHTTWDKDIDMSYFRLGNKKDPTIKERPTNVGFGISYTLPVVAQLLGARQGEIVCIENPEAHVHPVGQTSLGKLIALTAQSGIQVIIETHSDHLIDGMRIAVKENLIQHDNVAIFYFSKNNENTTECTHLQVSEDGDMSDWPQGFCDQAVKNLSKLANF